MEKKPYSIVKMKINPNYTITGIKKSKGIKVIGEKGKAIGELISFVNGNAKLKIYDKSIAKIINFEPVSIGFKTEDNYEK